MAETLVWFLLVDQEGAAFKGTSASKVKLPAGGDVDDLRRAVYAENPRKLSHCDASDLLVYADKTAFDANSADVPTNLQPEDGIGQYGASDAKMYVVVPDQEPTVTSGVAVPTNPPTAPHPHRLQRWSKINRILSRSKKKKARTDEEGFTTPYSSSRWTAVGPVFDEDRINYAEHVHPIPASDLEVLSKVLTWIMKCFGWTLIDLKDNEAKRLHVIAPILWAVVQLLPDVTIYIEQDLDGNRVDAHGHFEFVLVRGDRRVCIVEAKEEKFKQGMAQALLGCEVAADLDDSHEVYAVVTNVEKWIFLKSLDEEILCDEFNALTFGENGVPHTTQLKKITGKLHSMLTDQRLEQ